MATPRLGLQRSHTTGTSPPARLVGLRLGRRGIGGGGSGATAEQTSSAIEPAEQTGQGATAEETSSAAQAGAAGAGSAGGHTGNGATGEGDRGEAATPHGTGAAATSGLDSRGHGPEETSSAAGPEEGTDG